MEYYTFFISISSLIFNEKLSILFSYAKHNASQYELNFFSLNLINPLELYVLVNKTEAIFSLLT